MAYAERSKKEGVVLTGALTVKAVEAKLDPIFFEAQKDNVYYANLPHAKSAIAKEIVKESSNSKEAESKIREVNRALSLMDEGSRVKFLYFINAEANTKNDPKGAWAGIQKTLLSMFVSQPELFSNFISENVIREDLSDAPTLEASDLFGSSMKSSVMRDLLTSHLEEFTQMAKNLSTSHVAFFSLLYSLENDVLVRKAFEQKPKTFTELCKLGENFEYLLPILATQEGYDAFRKHPSEFLALVKNARGYDKAGPEFFRAVAFLLATDAFEKHPAEVVEFVSAARKGGLAAAAEALQVLARYTTDLGINLFGDHPAECVAIAKKLGGNFSSDSFLKEARKMGFID